jgi:hypothetical protein
VQDKKNSFYDEDKMKKFSESFVKRSPAIERNKEKYDQSKKSVYDEMEKEKVDQKYRRPW